MGLLPLAAAPIGVQGQEGGPVTVTWHDDTARRHALEAPTAAQRPLEPARERERESGRIGAVTFIVETANAARKTVLHRQAKTKVGDQKTMEANKTEPLGEVVVRPRRPQHCVRRRLVGQKRSALECDLLSAHPGHGFQFQHAGEPRRAAWRCS